jgi:divalent metal cation (Fe/Co/Zn/Cd) transporter
VLSQNLDYLLDSAQVDESVVRGIVCGVAGVASAHKIRTRGAPGAIHVDLHIQIASHLDVVQAHQVTHWVIDAVKRGVPGVLDVVVHTEPALAGLPYPPLPPHMQPGNASGDGDAARDSDAAREGGPASDPDQQT